MPKPSRVRRLASVSAGVGGRLAGAGEEPSLRTPLTGEAGLRRPLSAPGDRNLPLSAPGDCNLPLSGPPAAPPQASPGAG